MQDIAPPVGGPGKAALPYHYMWETRGNWLTAGEISFGRCRWTRNRDSPVQSRAGAKNVLKASRISLRDLLYPLPQVTASAVVGTSSEVVRNRNAARGPRGGKHFRFRAHIRANPCFIRDARRYAARSRALLFIQIFARNIILRHLMRAHFPLIVAPGVLHASYDSGLERVSFLD